MKLLRSYLRQHRLGILTYVLVCGIFVVSFCLYRLPLAAVAYPAALCALAGLGVLTADFLRVRAKHRELTAMQAHCTALLSELEANPDMDINAALDAIQAEVDEFMMLY